MLKIKYRADSSYDKHKARLVARGFLAKIGGRSWFLFESTFSPMASLAAVRVMASCMASLAVTMGTDLNYSDIPTAFIQSNLDSDRSWMKDDEAASHHVHLHVYVRTRTCRRTPAGESRFFSSYEIM